MNLANFPTGITDWSSLPESEHPGASGTAKIRTHQLGDIQLRLITYTAGYIADHWCHKGHIVFVLEGEILIEHQNAASHTITSGSSYHVADNDGPPHRLASLKGAKVFVVD